MFTPALWIGWHLPIWFFFPQCVFQASWPFEKNLRILIHHLVFTFQLSLSGAFQSRLQSPQRVLPHCQFKRKLLSFLSAFFWRSLLLLLGSNIIPLVRRHSIGLFLLPQFLIFLGGSESSQKDYFTLQATSREVCSLSSVFLVLLCRRF